MSYSVSKTEPNTTGWSAHSYGWLENSRSHMMLEAITHGNSFERAMEGYYTYNHRHKTTDRASGNLLSQFLARGVTHLPLGINVLFLSTETSSV
jgi:hypothetical protein